MFFGQPVPEGAQFFLFYGGIANIDLLRLYGFALRDNPHDRVDIWAPLNPNGTHEAPPRVGPQGPHVGHTGYHSSPLSGC